MIKTVIRSSGNMVIVFDRRGQQIPEYQGRYDEVKERTLKAAPINAVFVHDFTNSGVLREVSREEW